MSMHILNCIRRFCSRYGDISSAKKDIRRFTAFSTRDWYLILQQPVNASECQSVFRIDEAEMWNIALFRNSKSISVVSVHTPY